MVKAAMFSTLRVRDVMSEAILLLRTDTSVEDAWQQLHDGGVTGAPVLDARGRLVGVLSNYDLADPRRRRPDGSPGTIGEVMTRVVYADQRHHGHDVRVLLARREVYDAARRRHPARWSRHPRHWNAPAAVALNLRDRQTSARATEALRIGATSSTSMVPATPTRTSISPLRHHAESASPA